MKLTPSALLAIAAAFPLGCAPEPVQHPGRGVLVIAIDALRADHVGAYGYDRATTTRLDRLAEEGVLFEDAWAAAPELMGSHVSLLTGCDPTLARRPPLPDGTQLDEIAAWWIPKEVPRLAREFLQAGYRTSAFVDHPRLSPVYGFDVGFEHFTGYRDDVRGRELGFEAVGDKFLRWLDDIGEGDDWFAYVHVNDLDRMWEMPERDAKWDTFFEPREELNYRPPVSEADSVFFAVPRVRFKYGGIRTVGQYEARYDGAVRRLGNGIARLFARMKHEERWDDTTVVVVGTYGMGFGESGVYLASGTLSGVDLRVPLIVRPGDWLGIPAGRRIGDLVSLVDLAPTLLELSDVPVPETVGGVSFAGRLRGGEGAPRATAFASGGLQLGWVAVDERWIYEWSAPGSRRPGPLVVSWYGVDEPGRVEYRSFLARRERLDPLSNLGPSLDEPDVAQRLGGEAEAWFREADRLRDTLHVVPWARQ